jgi:ubiquinone/menaquinone biosynthesis C-methylase UbiE
MRPNNVLPIASELPGKAGEAIGLHPKASVPDYLRAHYWWAYIHPKAVKLFERQWLVNLILWGNYARLRDAALAEMGDPLSGTTLQVACVYGDLTNCLSQRAMTGGGSIDIVDVLPIQLKNLRNKLPAGAPARLLAMDAMDLKLPDASYDRALVFFLLHEQPREWRERTLSEVLRVVKPGGKDHRRLCAAALVASAALPVSDLACEVRAVCPRFVAGRNHQLAAGFVYNQRAEVPVLRRTLSTGGEPALTGEARRRGPLSAPTRGTRGGPVGEEMGRPPFEGIQNLAEHCTKDARRDGRQHRIVEFVVYRKLQLSVILIPRLEVPDST